MELTGQTQGSDDVGTGRSAPEETFFTGEPSAHGGRFFGGDLEDLIGNSGAPEGNDKSGADAIDFMSARCASGKDGRFRRFNGGDGDFPGLASQVFRDTAQRSGGSDALHKAIDLSVSFGPRVPQPICDKRRAGQCYSSGRSRNFQFSARRCVQPQSCRV